jgi:type 1 fimbria pilin
MKHISNLSQATALVAALGAACLTSLSAHAADTPPNIGTLNLKASVSKATCALVIGDSLNSTNQTSYKTLNLGNIASDNKSNAKAKFTTFGAQKSVVFSLKDPADTTKACNLGGATKFTLNGQVASNTAVVNGESSFLKNKIAADKGGTDALVKIIVGGINGGKFDISTPLKEGNNELVTVDGNAGKAFLYAQFAYSGQKDATAGKFNYDLPVTVTYK